MGRFRCDVETLDVEVVRRIEAEGNFGIGLNAGQPLSVNGEMHFSAVIGKRVGEELASSIRAAGAEDGATECYDESA